MTTTHKKRRDLTDAYKAGDKHPDGLPLSEDDTLDVETSDSDVELETPPLTQGIAAAATELADFKTKLAAAEDARIRLMADLDNVRKRSARECATAESNARFEVIRAFLPAFDHFEMALATTDGNTQDKFKALYDGMKIIAQEFKKILADLGVDTIKTVGEPFDPKFHEAAAEEPSEQHKEGHVVKQWRTGYKVGERLLRAATVVVSGGPSTTTN